MATEWHPGGGGGGSRAGGSQPCPEAHAQRFQLPSRPRPCVKAQVTTAYPQVTPGRQVRRPEKISPRRWLQLVTSPRPGPPALPQGPLGADTGGQGGEASRETPAGRGTDDRALSHLPAHVQAPHGLLPMSHTLSSPATYPGQRLGGPGLRRPRPLLAGEGGQTPRLPCCRLPIPKRRGPGPWMLPNSLSPLRPGSHRC